MWRQIVKRWRFKILILKKRLFLLSDVASNSKKEIKWNDKMYSLSKIRLKKDGKGERRTGETNKNQIIRWQT